MRYIQLIPKKYASLEVFVNLSEEIINIIKEFENKYGEESLYDLKESFKIIFNNKKIELKNNHEIFENYGNGCCSLEVNLKEATELELLIKEWFDHIIQESNWIKSTEEWNNSSFESIHLSKDSEQIF